MLSNSKDGGTVIILKPPGKNPRLPLEFSQPSSLWLEEPGLRQMKNQEEISLCCVSVAFMMFSWMGGSTLRMA
jgi:hypothetical protein